MKTYPKVTETGGIDYWGHRFDQFHAYRRIHHLIRYFFIALGPKSWNPLVLGIHLHDVSRPPLDRDRSKRVLDIKNWVMSGQFTHHKSDKGAPAQDGSTGLHYSLYLLIPATPWDSDPRAYRSNGESTPPENDS